MLVKRQGEGTTLLVMLHWLGGSSRTWTEVIDGCASRGLSCAALDLPGFGRHAQAVTRGENGITVSTSVDATIAAIKSLRSDRSQPWILVGHSMGGKFAAIIARAALDGTPGLENLSGLVLISPSPPCPEPMDESARDENIESLGKSTREASEDRDRAGAFVDDNTGKLPLLGPVRRRAIDDLLRMNRSAFVDWFTTGSREDWASRVGTIHLPALVLAGTEESALGPDAQRLHTLPHLPLATLDILKGAGHLAPLERPAELVERFVAFVKDLGFPLHHGAESLNPAFRALIEGDLTSPQTRAVLQQRLADDDLPGPGMLNPAQLLTLRAIAPRIIPGCSFDLAARIDRWLALPSHDGWRHDTLPPDIEAWRLGFHSLDLASIRQYGVSFSALDSARQDSLLTQARDGHLDRSILDALGLTEGSNTYTAAQMSDWFSDLHAELTRIYVADPRTMQRIGFTGFADEAGFTQIRLGEQEEVAL